MKKEKSTLTAARATATAQAVPATGSLGFVRGAVNR